MAPNSIFEKKESYTTFCGSVECSLNFLMTFFFIVSWNTCLTRVFSRINEDKKQPLQKAYLCELLCYKWLIHDCVWYYFHWPSRTNQINMMFQSFRLVAGKIHPNNNLPHEAYQFAPKMGQVEILTSLYLFLFHAQVFLTFSKIITWSAR